MKRNLKRMICQKLDAKSSFLNGKLNYNNIEIKILF